MSVTGWLLWLLLCAAVLAAGIWHYRRRETPGRGRLLLACLRAAAVSLVLLLLFDPDLPGRAASSRGTLVLLDASLSMQLPAHAESTRWQRAVEEARRRAGDRPVLLFGNTARPAEKDALPDSAPGDVRTLLLPGLEAAAEAGVRGVVVITDGGIEDADAVARWAPRLGIDIATITVGAAAANRAITEVDAPRWVGPGEPVPVSFAVSGATSDSVHVVARRDGRVVGRTTLPPAAAGRLATGTMDLRLADTPGDSGWVRLDIAIDDADAVSDDNARTVYVQVGGEPAGVAVASFRPDWEPRFLAPVLGRSLGLPIRAYIRSATGQYVRLAGGLDAGAPATDADVRRAVERGQLVVLHGLGADAPAWAHDAARTARHVLIFPADDVSPGDLPAQVGTPVTGDFFASGAVPASPVAALLTDVDVAGAAPLSSLRPAVVQPGAWAPLMATRGRQGPTAPIVVAGESGGRRWAIALGAGYWQWAFRGGAERQLYNRLWSSLGGWLAQEQAVAAVAPLRPAEMVLPRGATVPWIAPGATPDSVHVTATDPAGAVVLDTTITTVSRDTVFTRAPAPGHYSYRARAFTGATLTEGRGVFTVETWSPEFARGTVDPLRLEADAVMVRDGDTARRGVPLHAAAIPYLLVIVLLATEWILRRRWGLR